MAQTAPQFDWESARPVDEEPQQPAATPSATDSSYPGAPLNDKQEAATLSPVQFDWESARPVESAQDFDLESAVPLKELAKDPAYLMSREQFRAYRNESKETDSAVADFLGGIPGVIPGLASMASGAIGELGQQVAQNWYRPDKLLASLTANQNEGVRRMSLSYAKMVDYIGQNLRDMDINRQREAAYGEQLRQKMQQEGKLTGDPIKDHEMVMQALFAAKDAGEIPLTDQQMAEDEERAYQDYWRGKNFDQAIGNITDIKIAGTQATTPSMEWGARNMLTGEYVAPGKSSPDVVSMGIDPANILAAGVGSLARVNALRRAGILLGKGLGPTGEVLAKAGAAVGRGADAVTERIQLATGGQRVGEKVIGGLSPEMQAYGGVTSAAAVGYMTGGDTTLDKAMTASLAMLPAIRMTGATLRKAGTAANAGWIIAREMDAGAMSAAQADVAKGLGASSAIPERYAKFIRGEGRASADSTLRRVAQDQANPRLLRSFAQLGDNVGLTSAVRAADDAIGGALVGASATVPFALAAPEPEQAGNIIGMGLTLGAAGGVAGGKMTRMAEMQDAMVARMLVDSQASGGNAEAFARLPHQDLVSMAGLQAFSRGKLKFVPLTTSEYRVNLDVTKRRGENSAGFYVETADDGSSKVFINMGEPSAAAGVVAKIRPVTKGGKTIEIRDKDGNSTFTYVPNDSRIAVKQGDSVSVGTPLTRGTPSRLSVPEEIAHAIFSSKAMDGLPRDEMRNYINQRYKTEGVAARGREYAARIVDQDIAAGVYGAANSIDDATRNTLVEQRFTEFSQASIEDGADPLDWARDEIIAASLRASVQGIDLARLRNQSNFSRLAEQVVASSAQALRVLGVDVDKMGRVLDPAGTFRDNPVFADPAMRRMVTKYMRDYDQWLAGMEDAGRKDRRGVRVAPSGRAEDLANSQHTVLREVKDANGNGTGVFENDVITRGPDGVVRPKKQADIDRTEVSRAAQIKSLWDAGKTVPTASTEFGKRRVNGRDIVGGPTLPPQWDLFTQFPQWIREFARQLEAGRGDGRTWIADYNAIGSGDGGRYRVINLGNIEAIIREVAFVSWQITKKNHLLATVFDMNAFRAAVKRAIDAGELGELGNNMDEVNAALLQYLDNHKNGRPGEYGIGQTKKNILNGLIGTGTAKQTAANPFYAELNPRGSVRTFRVDRLNDLRDTGRTGYNFMYEPINANMMPDAMRAPKDLSTDQILRELEENQGYLGLSTLGMREGRPVHGGAQRTRELLRRNEELNAELRKRGGTQEESDVERILRRRGQAMPDVAAEPWRMTKEEFFHPQVSRRFIDAENAPDGTIIGTIGSVVHGEKTRAILKPVLDVPIMVMRFPVQGGKKVSVGGDYVFDGSSGRFDGKPAIFINPNERMVGTLWEEAAHQMRRAKGRPIRKTDIAKVSNDDAAFERDYKNDPEELSAKRLAEYLGSLASKEKSHREIVQEAISAGLPVPDAVQAQYTATGRTRGQAMPDANPIEDSARKIHSVYDKNLLAKDRDTALYPQNPVPGSVVLPPRYGLVGNAPGMPRNFTEVRELVKLLADRVEDTGRRDVPFAQKSARFYSDMANEAVSLAEIVDPQSTGTARFNRADEMLRYLALGSQRTNVPVNSTKSAGAAASVVGNFTAGYKMGFGEAQRATRQAQADFKAGKHFNLDTKGVQDKVRTFYINGLSELIELARKSGDRAAVEMLETRAAKSLKLVDPNTPKLTPEQLKETERILAGKATIDMWDMAAKRVAVPGFILDPKKRADLKQPFEWTQKSKAVKDTIGSPRWAKVAKELGVDSPAELRYQQARSLGIDGNFDWTAETWKARVDSGAPFAGGDFTTYTGSTDAGLSPGGGGRLYDAQQAIDGLLADELNRRGLASMFGKDKLFARNAQEILWAIEKKDNPILANNDLSLFGDSIQPLKEELRAIAGTGGQRNVRGAQVLDAMERAYTAMAMQEMPFEVATVGTGRTATAINSALASMKEAGDPDPLARMTAHYANNLANELTDLATEHGMKLQVDSVKTDLGGFTMDDGTYTETPQITAVIRGNTADTKYLMQVVNEAVEQQGGNLFRRPSVKELYDPAVEKQPVVSFETSQMTTAQRTAFVTDLAKIRDSNGNRIFTGYTPSENGVFIGGQFYDGDFMKAVNSSMPAVRAVMKKHGVTASTSENMVVPSYRSSDKVAPSAFRDAVQKLFYDKAVSGVAPNAPTSIVQPANVAGNLQSRLRKNEAMFAGRENLDALAKAINESGSMSADQALARVGQTMEIPGTKKMQAAFSDYVRGNRKKYEALPAADKKAVSEYIKQAREAAKALRDQEAAFSRAAKEGIRRRRAEIADRYDPQRALDEIDAASLLGYMGDLEVVP